MGPLIDAWFVLLASVASWLNREQNKALEYLLAKNAVLKEQLTRNQLSKSPMNNPLPHHKSVWESRADVADFVGHTAGGDNQACGAVPAEIQS